MTKSVAIGLSLTFDWLRRWREISTPITERSKAKPIQFRITFDTQLKLALYLNVKVKLLFKVHKMFREGEEKEVINA